MKYITIFYFLLWPCLLRAQAADSGRKAGNEPPVVSTIRIEGAISVTAADYVHRALQKAREQQAECLLVELDTPGGLLKSMKHIVQDFLDSKDLPVIVYVSPEGASAASAGTFITMAAHIAAMAPTTNIGAASPVQMGSGGKVVQTDTVMQKKLFNYSESYIKTIAQRRNRNAKWAVAAVHDGESITAKEALRKNVIDLMAGSRSELLQKINGRVVEGDTLHTQDAEVHKISKTLAERLFGFVTQSQIMLILTLIAIYGIVGEVTNPGAVLPGTAGAIALILLLYASASLPIDMTGFLLIGLAIALFIIEAFTPTFGVLLGGGAVSFFLGSIILFQDFPVSMQLSWGWLIGATILTTLFFGWIITAGIKAQFAKVVSGQESMIGKRGKVVDPVDENGGRIFVSGEYWNAVSEKAIEEGHKCEVVAIKGLTLTIKEVINNNNNQNN